MLDSKEEHYIRQFNDSQIRKEALKQALDIRKFEIELYWKRATYFWTFIAATFAGYFLILKTDDGPKEILFLLSCLGLSFSYSWYLVNKGSKFWQNNWERHVDLLEDREMGPLYKTVINNKNLSKLLPHTEYPYSVSKINQLLSFYLVIIWLFLALSSFAKSIHLVISDGKITVNLNDWLPIGILILTILFIITVTILGQSNISDKKAELEITNRKTN